jgi:hypothetical protein
VSRSRRRISKHCHYTASNRGVVRLSGHDHYTGPWGSPEAEATSERLVGEWLANRRTLPSDAAADRPPIAAPAGPTVADLILAFWRHAELYYRHPDGTPTSELANYRQSVRPIRAVYVAEPAAAFSPSKLKAIRARWVPTGI